MMPLTMVFAVTQMPLIKRYHLEPASLEASEAEAGGCEQGVGRRARLILRLALAGSDGRSSL